MNCSWSRVREMLRKEWRQIFRDPRMKPIIFVSPVVQLLLFGYAVNTDIRLTRTFVVDHDKTVDSRQLVAALTATGYFEIVARSDDPADLGAALDRGQAVVGLMIPVNFSRELHAGRGARVQVLVDGTDSNTGTVAQGYAVRIVQEFGRENGPVAAGLQGGIDLRTRAWFNPELQSRVYNVPGVIGVLLLLMCLLLTALAVVRERELGTLDQLMVTPLHPGELMLGKTIPVAVIGLIDLVLITVVAIFWFGIPLRGSVLSLLPAAMIYIVAGLSFGLLISSISRTQQEAFMTMFLFLLPSIVLSGFFYPISSMPVVFQWLTVINPVRHFLEIVRGIFLNGTGILELWPQYLILTAMAGGGLWFATYRFQRSVR